MLEISLEKRVCPEKCVQENLLNALLNQQLTTTQPKRTVGAQARHGALEPVPMAPLPTVAPYNKVVPTPGAGPSAEGQAGTGPSRIGSARRVSPQSSKSRLFTFNLSTGKSRNFAKFLDFLEKRVPEVEKGK